MTCSRPLILKDRNNLAVPCGQCFNCLKAKRYEWSLRLKHESVQWGLNQCFITLTYCDEYLPKNLSLNKDELAKTIKRLRKRLANRRIKIFACGEYGDEGGRPHYHLIVFGLSIAEHKYRELKNGVYLVTSGPIFDVWKDVKSKESKGGVTIGVVVFERMMYVAGYVQKKYSLEFIERGVQPPFMIFSRGLGKRFVEENADRLLKDLGYKMNGKEMPFPKYYQNYLKKLDEGFQDRFIEKAKEANKSINKIVYSKGMTPEEVKKEIKKWNINKERENQKKKDLFEK